FANDYYPNSPLGVTADRKLNIDPDISWSPFKELVTHFFYSYEEVFYELHDTLTPGGGGAPFSWSIGTPNTVHTAGFDSNWQATDDLKVGIGYTFQYGNTAFDESGAGTGSLGTSPFNFIITPLPSNTSVLNTLNLHGEYSIADRASVLFGYTYER